MIPGFDRYGNLPPGIHEADWSEFQESFRGSVRRRDLLIGMQNALDNLAAAGCLSVYVDGSFVTSRAEPGDYDICWDVQGVDDDKLDPVFYDFNQMRRSQKEKYGGEFFPTQMRDMISGKTLLEFFQTDREGHSKGIILLKLSEWRQEKNDDPK